MRKSMRFTQDEVNLLVAVVASVDPERYVDPEVRAVIHKAKAALDAAEALRRGD